MINFTGNTKKRVVNLGNKNQMILPIIWKKPDCKGNSVKNNGNEKDQV